LDPEELKPITFEIIERSTWMIKLDGALGRL
jgi:hypothetical protein